ncbi:hypothetical protein Tco_1318695 [Tanacetum coccineum]
MDIIRDQQFALDDALVAPANRVKIGKTDVLKIYMQEFWATATVHHHSIRFKINNKKHIVNLEYFREMLQICPKLPDQQFEELPFEEEILTFLRDLGHNGEIKVITDVNVNKLHQPWRSFTAVINKCLSGLFRSVLSRNMQNLEMQFSNETLHEKDSNSELRAIKGQFEHFIHSKMFCFPSIIQMLGKYYKISMHTLPWKLKPSRKQ